MGSSAGDMNGMDILAVDVLGTATLRSDGLLVIGLGGTVGGVGSTIGLMGEDKVAVCPRMEAMVLLGGPMANFFGVFLMLGPFLVSETGTGILEVLAWSGVLNDFFTTSGVAVGSLGRFWMSGEHTVCKQTRSKVSGEHAVRGEVQCFMGHNQSTRGLASGWLPVTGN